jgi:hypothetical protein
LPLESDPDDKIMPYFMKEYGRDCDISAFRDSVTRMIEELELLKGAWITNAIDRDCASQEGVTLKEFERDL